MKEQKVICPVCGGEVKEDECLLSDIFENESVEACIGTCEKCGETVEYDRVYPHKDYKIEIVDHYKN